MPSDQDKQVVDDMAAVAPEFSKLTRDILFGDSPYSPQF